MSTSEALLFVTPHKYAIGIFSDNKIHSLMINSATCDWLTELRGQFPDVELLPPASEKAIADAEKTGGQLPGELVELLTCSNGLVVRSFRLFSAFDSQHIKKTWESLQRFNVGPAAVFKDPSFANRFLVFGDIGNGFAMIDRNDGTIWFMENEDDEIRQTDFSFREFIETMASS